MKSARMTMLKNYARSPENFRMDVKDVRFFSLLIPVKMYQFFVPMNFSGYKEACGRSNLRIFATY